MMHFFSLALMLLHSLLKKRWRDRSAYAASFVYASR